MIPQHTAHQRALYTPLAPASSTEQHLLQRLAQGDRLAFWDLWEHYRDACLFPRCLQWMRGNQADAEDALSSACLKALEKLSIYAKDISNIKGWLLQFLHHHCMDIRRARARQYHAVTLGDDYTTPVSDIVRQDEATPEQLLLWDETQQAIDRALAHLPLRLRTPAVLRFCHELPYRDIAEHLNLTPATVRKRIQQARALLQEELRHYES